MILIHTVLIWLIGTIVAASISVRLFLIAALLGFRFAAWTSKSSISMPLEFCSQVAHLCLSITDTGCSRLVICSLYGTGSKMQSQGQRCDFHSLACNMLLIDLGQSKLAVGFIAVNVFTLWFCWYWSMAYWYLAASSPSTPASFFPRKSQANFGGNNILT